MKTMQRSILLVLFLSLLSHCRTTSGGTPAGTAFTYQGRLNDGTIPATGFYDLSFTIYDAEINGDSGAVLTNAATPVIGGLFTVTLDFGGVFDGNARWLEISVRTNGGSAFTKLSPRQRLTPIPYAIQALNAASVAATNVIGSLTTTQLPANVALLNSSPRFTGTVTAGAFAGDGAGLTNLPATNLTGTLPNARLSSSVPLLSDGCVTNPVVDSRGRLQTARDILTPGTNGTRWMLIGDSITADMQSAYGVNIRASSYSGAGGLGNGVSFYSGNVGIQTSNYNAVQFGLNDAAGNLVNYSPFGSWSWVTAAGTVSQYAWNLGGRISDFALWSQVGMTNQDPANYVGGEWFLGRTNVTWTAAFLKTTNGVSGGVCLRAVNMSGMSIIAESPEIDMTGANMATNASGFTYLDSSGKYVVATVTFDCPASARCFLSWANASGSVTVPDNKQIIWCGSRFSNNRGGLEILGAGSPGSSVMGSGYRWSDHTQLDPSSWELLNIFKVDVVGIWLGANGRSVVDRASFKTALRSLMNDMLAVRPSLHFVLISTYDLRGNGLLANWDPWLSEYASAMRQLADEDPTLLFLDLNKEAGPYSSFSSAYLSDGTHPNAAGNAYFTQVLYRLLDSAAHDKPAGANSIAQYPSLEDINAATNQLAIATTNRIGSVSNALVAYVNAATNGLGAGPINLSNTVLTGTTILSNAIVGGSITAFSGIILPAGAQPGYVLTSDANGRGSWHSITATNIGNIPGTGLATVTNSDGSIVWSTTGTAPLASQDGSALTNLNAAQIQVGTLADARLSANVALKTFVTQATNDLGGALAAKLASTNGPQVFNPTNVGTVYEINPNDTDFFVWEWNGRDRRLRHVQNAVRFTFSSQGQFTASSGLGVMDGSALTNINSAAVTPFATLNVTNLNVFGDMVINNGRTNTALKTVSITNALYLFSPSGTRYRIKVSDEGVLSANAE